MLDYLKKYNISDEQINNLVDILKNNNMNIDLFEYASKDIMKILDLFTSLGVDNIYEIIITNPTMFCDTYGSIKRRIDSYPDKEELARLLNEDTENLSLIGLL